MIKLVSFDFDGTLADSVDFCLACFDKVFEKFMRENAPTREEIYQTFGMNEPGVIRHFMGGFVPEAEEYFYKLHRELHQEWCPDVYAGCRELLEFLQSKNVTATVLTGRSETTCRISLEVLDLEKYFAHVQNGSPEKNDKAAQMRFLLEKYNLNADELVYVGDAVSDAEAAHRAGVKCLSAAWAKSARIPQLEEINPGLVFTDVKSMQEYIAARI